MYRSVFFEKLLFARRPKTARIYEILQFNILITRAVIETRLSHINVLFIADIV